MNNVRIFLSGPMSGKINNNKEAFDRAEKALRAVGYEVFNPANSSNEARWLKNVIDHLTYVEMCDGVAQLPEQEDEDISYGMVIEAAVAQKLGKKILPLDVWITEAVEIL